MYGNRCVILTVTFCLFYLELYEDLTWNEKVILDKEINQYCSSKQNTPINSYHAHYEGYFYVCVKKKKVSYFANKENISIP